MFMSMTDYDDGKVKFIILTKILFFVEWSETSLNFDGNIRFATYGEDYSGEVLKEHASHRDINGKTHIENHS